jgi:hypothetical protein
VHSKFWRLLWHGAVYSGKCLRNVGTAENFFQILSVHFFNVINQFYFQYFKNCFQVTAFNCHKACILYWRRKRQNCIESLCNVLTVLVLVDVWPTYRQIRMSKPSLIGCPRCCSYDKAWSVFWRRYGLADSCRSRGCSVPETSRPARGVSQPMGIKQLGLDDDCRSPFSVEVRN